ncbi:dienelactone hydrolase family protein [Anaerosporobacter faecicola]|uniref:dienelactone hydrolase family protein n=1 Tax=Anaerosporobacter faecicola TaxID=2718714 RepID=UPI00143BCC09|nr:dienelactone hydrolase family protein [Anaerosporobacter faecicola]
MKEKRKKSAMIILHEIYGMNPFIQDMVSKWKDFGYDVVGLDLLQRDSFPYEKAEEAYSYFINQVGFDAYIQVNEQIHELKKNHENVYVLGFSVGATIAWRCSENPECDGIIACYGSRIRDYMNVKPACKVKLIFAEQDSFPVDLVMERLQGIPNVQCEKWKAHHGFLDSYSMYYQPEYTEKILGEMEEFYDACE